MSKLDGIKEKLSNFKETAREKLDKISLLGWKKKDASAAAPGAPNPYSIGEMYRSGSTATRLQIFFVFIFLVSGIALAIYASKKFLKGFKSTTASETLKKEYTHGFEELNRKALEKATLISLGKFQAKIKLDGNDRYVAIDLWLRITAPESAEFLRKNELIVNDKVVSAFQDIHTQSVDLLSEDGKKVAKGILKKHIDTILPKGEVQDAFFENLIVQ